MSDRRTTIFAWSLFAVFGAMMLANLAMVAFGPAAEDELFVVALAGYPLVGTLIAVRRPDNAIGWLLIAIGLSFAFTTLVDAYVLMESPPGVVAAAWVSNWVWFVWLTLAGIFLPLVFPNGRLLSRRWRPVLWLAAAGLAASVAGTAFAPGRLDVDSARPIENPLGVGGEAAEAVIAALSTIGDVLAAASFLLAATSLVLRFRRSRGRERQQLKWFAYAGMVVAGGLTLAMMEVLFGLEPGADPEDAGALQLVGAIGWFTALFGIIFGIPLATGIAVLRHNLYGIDVVIRRTLVYTGLTATLVGSYLAGVLLLQLALGPLTEDNDLAIAGSTLAVAGLFRPARARIKEAVDRRFFRQKYDAAHTIESFGSRLRDEVELDAVVGDLRGVVRDTMQPAHVSLWLRAPQ